jgi:DNA-directed RNA polymerase specialized sigma24 family protein
MTSTHAQQASLKAHTAKQLGEFLIEETNSGEPLEALSDVYRLTQTLSSLTRSLVLYAREQGESWEHIAAALHVTRQTVHERFATNLPIVNGPIEPLV